MCLRAHAARRETTMEEVVHIRHISMNIFNAQVSFLGGHIALAAVLTRCAALPYHARLPAMPLAGRRRGPSLHHRRGEVTSRAEGDTMGESRCCSALVPLGCAIFSWGLWRYLARGRMYHITHRAARAGRYACDLLPHGSAILYLRYDAHHAITCHLPTAPYRCLISPYHCGICWPYCTYCADCYMMPSRCLTDSDLIPYTGSISRLAPLLQRADAP